LWSINEDITAPATPDDEEAEEEEGCADDISRHPTGNHFGKWVLARSSYENKW